jgi:hypothetical protein
MHPLIDSVHPLCTQEVLDYKKCGEENAYLGKLAVTDLCEPFKHMMKACFREEKILRKELNKKQVEEARSAWRAARERAEAAAAATASGVKG